MGTVKMIYTLVLIFHLRLSCCDVNSISWHFLGCEGLNLPIYTEKIVVNDVTLFHYDSSMTSTAPSPGWMNTTATQQHWKETSSLAYHNWVNMAQALQTVKLQFNLTDTDINIYQGYSRCERHPNGTKVSLLAHGFNGMDFLSLDIENKRYIASVSQASVYKRIREGNIILLETMVSFYKTTCFDRLDMFLNHAPGVNKKSSPQVRLFERQRAGSTLLTCHVTGFYPRAVQVKWMGAGLELVEDEMNDVLPNGDGTYQTRRSVIRPEENTDDQRYSCVVHHGSLPGNLTVTWGREQNLFRLPCWIALGCFFMVVVVGLVIRCVSKRNAAPI